ncbi:MAG: hypothetical protein D6732_14185 [Methanobacteriota archaeon]|nr:MAG: hypothetical protein D6732_14185 [Euryarchaeota archaeon]
MLDGCVIVSVVSFRGGSGKSFFSLNLARSLHDMGTRTILVEADFLAPSYHYISEREGMTWNEFILGEREEITPSFTLDGLEVICTSPNDQRMLKQIHNDQLWSTTISDQISWFLNKMEKKKDVIVFDNQGGLFYSTLVHCFFSDFVICILRPDHNDVRSTVTYLKTLKRPFWLVWNSIIKWDEVSKITDRWTEKYFAGLENYRGVLGKIPFDEESAFLKWIKGITFPTGTEYQKAVGEISNRLLELKDNSLSDKGITK